MDGTVQGPELHLAGQLDGSFSKFGKKSSARRTPLKQEEVESETHRLSQPVKHDHVKTTSDEGSHKPERRSPPATAPSCLRGSSQASESSRERERCPWRSPRCCTTRPYLQTDTHTLDNVATLVSRTIIIRGEDSPDVAALTVVDLKVMDTKSFEDGDARLMDVERLTQLGV